MDRILLPLLTAFIITFATTPLFRRLAIKVDAVDRPRDDRRVHKKPIPYFGGLGIYLAIMVTVLYFGNNSPKQMAILLGATVINIMGVIDDLKDLSPKTKLAVQMAVGFYLVYNGIFIDNITNPLSFRGASTIDLPNIVSDIVTVFWITGITNTVNLIDGLDGLATGVSAISALSLMAVAYKLGYVNSVLLSSVLAGACLGFLPYNFNPASIFLGDAGSLFLGYMLATISIEGVMKSSLTIAAIVPMLILVIPIFDTTFAIFRRLAKGQHPMKADKGHLHHRLLRKGYSQKKTTLILYSISAIFGAIAFISVQADARVSVRLSIALFIATLYMIFILTRTDLKEEGK